MVVMNELTNNNHATCSAEVTSRKEGLTFIQALNQKYVDQEDFDQQFRVPKDTSISTEITFVGFNEVSNVQKQLRMLASIDLSNFGIEKSGDIHKIRGYLDRVTVLNLSQNLLSWMDVIHILDCLPSLKEMILTANNLTIDEDIEYPKKPFRKLTSIVVGKTNLAWQTIINILLKIWMQIDQIDLWDSQLSDDSMQLSPESQAHQFVSQVKSIALSYNHFTRLSWIPKMGQLDSLVELDVSHCKLTKLDMSGEVSDNLKNLKVLNISYNDLGSWQEVAQLHSLPCLTSLICNDNPFYLTDKYARSHTTATIGGLSTLNRETITTAFRRDSEILYLKNFFSEYDSFTKGKNENFKRAHPRYERLVDIYGLLGDVATNKISADDKFVTVKLCHGELTMDKKVPRNMRVSNLKMLCKTIFRLRSPRGIELVCCDADPAKVGLSYPLDQDGQTLHFFSVENGHRLVIKLDE